VFRRFLIILLLSLSASLVQAAGISGMLAEGRAQFSVTAGNAYAFENRYFVIGGSASYYVLDGLGVGISLENWSGSGPRITKYAPFVQYVFYQIPLWHPYVGSFFRRTTVAGLPSINSVGARAGVMMASGANASVSIGFVHESYLDCNVSVYRVCSETYPDISVAFGF